MASLTLPSLSPSEFHKVHAAIVSAIVRLNFNEPDEARDLLLDALTEINFAKKEGI
jgi:hypothetical protein